MPMAPADPEARLSAPTPTPFGPGDTPRALRAGWRTLRERPGPSLALGLLLGLTGGGLLMVPARLGMSPLVWVLAGGFLLLGPVVLAGFIGLYRRHERGERPRLGDALQGLAEAGGGFWAMAGVCVLVFLVWVTDAAVLYALQVGTGPITEGPAPSAGGWGPSPGVSAFTLWSSLLGAVLALGLFPVTAFSVPLLYERRAGMVAAVHASVGAVVRNPAASLVWAFALVSGMSAAIIVPPLLPLVLPVLAYGSFALYRRVFPPVPCPIASGNGTRGIAEPLRTEHRRTEPRRTGTQR